MVDKYTEIVLNLTTKMGDSSLWILLAVVGVLVLVLGVLLYVALNKYVGIVVILLSFTVFLLGYVTSQITEDGWKDYNMKQVGSAEEISGVVEEIKVDGSNVKYVVGDLEYATKVDKTKELKRFSKGDRITFVVYNGYLPTYNEDDERERLSKEYITEVVGIQKTPEREG